MPLPTFEWDEGKNRLNIQKHGIDFRDAIRIFERPTLDRIDGRQDYGEARINSIGEIDGQVIVNVTHTDRGRAIRLISARQAKTAERKLYRAFRRWLAHEPSRDR